MRILSIIVVFANLLQVSGYGQQIAVEATLQELIKETSGLIFLNQKLITHNDSGGEPALYEVDSLSGQVKRTVVIANAANTDWEDICHDSTYIYIADFGNNYGSRTDLSIYRLSVSDYMLKDTVTVDTIRFSYSDQKDFSGGLNSTDYDAEALISYNGHLYIFTKNWNNYWTYIYEVPKIPGTYQLERTDSINAEGLVTGATYNATSKTVVLTGYAFIVPFIIEIRDIPAEGFSGGSIYRYLIELEPGFSSQIEGIASLNEREYYLTAEESYLGGTALYRLRTDVAVRDQPDITSGIHVYPNPASGLVRIDCVDFSEVEIYDLQGILHKTSANKSMYVSDLNNGIYILAIKNRGGDRVWAQKLIIE